MPKRVGNRSVSLFFQEDLDSRNQFAQTPETLMEYFEEKYGKFDFDPCPPNPEINGLQIDWGNRNYVNPPFNNLKPWLIKSVEEWKKGKEVIFLMPIRIHTTYFLDNIQPLIESGDVKMFILRGGVCFKGYKHRAPFGMMYLYFTKNNGGK